jgi:hypothetical protein
LFIGNRLEKAGGGCREKGAYGLPCSLFDHKPDGRKWHQIMRFRLTAAAGLHILDVK